MGSSESALTRTQAHALDLARRGLLFVSPHRVSVKRDENGWAAQEPRRSTIAALEQRGLVKYEPTGRTPIPWTQKVVPVDA